MIMMMVVMMTMVPVTGMVTVTVTVAMAMKMVVMIMLMIMKKWLMRNEGRGGTIRKGECGWGDWGATMNNCTFAQPLWGTQGPDS